LTERNIFERLLNLNFPLVSVISTFVGMVWHMEMYRKKSPSAEHQLPFETN